MNNYKAIIKLLLKDRFATRGKRHLGFFAALAVAYGCIMVGFVTTIIFLAKQLGRAYAPQLMTLIMVMDCLMVFAFGIFSIIGSLYLSKDNEFMLALPVKASTVYAAKISYIYLTEFVMSAALLLPSMLAMGITLGLGPMFYLGLLLALVFTPALPVFLAAIVAAPLMYIVSFFRNKGAFTSIASLVVFAAFFAAYYVVVGRFGSGEGEASVALLGSLNNVCNVFYPYYAIAKFSLLVPYAGFSTAASAFLNFIIFFFGMLALAGLSVLISSFVYRKSISSQLENGRKKKTVEGTFASSGVVKALVKREWKDILRNSTYAMQCLAGVIISPILVAFFAFTSVDTGGAGSQFSADIMQWLMITMLILLLGAAINVGASTCFSRDGQTYYYVKMMPVSIFRQLKAKRILYTSISIVSTTLGVIVATIGIAMHGTARFAWWMPILIWILGITTSFAIVNFAIFMDFSRPNLYWKTYREIAKNSRNAMVPTLIGMVIAFVLIGLAFGTFILLENSPVLASVLALLIPTVISIVLCIIFYCI